jgi:hypothetical protein
VEGPSQLRASVLEMRSCRLKGAEVIGKRFGNQRKKKKKKKKNKKKRKEQKKKMKTNICGKMLEKERKGSLVPKG